MDQKWDDRTSPINKGQGSGWTTTTVLYVCVSCFVVHGCAVSRRYIYIHTPSLQLHPHTHHIVTPEFVDRPRWSDGAAGLMRDRLAGGPKVG